MFNSTRLTIARQRNGLTKSALAEKIQMSPRSVSGYESGIVPPAEVLERISEATGFPVAFFDGDDLRKLDPHAVSFRALSKMSATERDRATSAGELALALNAWIEQRFELPVADLPDSSQETDPEAAAVSLRQQWHLGEAPIANMIHLLESKGVRVYSLVVDSLNVDAFSTWIDETPLMVLNTRKSAERSRFDAAHELGHLVLHRHAKKEVTRLAEAEANQFAAAFLMPRSGVNARAPRFPTIPRLVNLKQHWGVSVAALNHRLHQLGVTSDWQYHHLAAEISKLGYRKKEPESGVRESSQVLSKVFAELRKDGISQRDLAADLNLPLDQIRQLVFGLTVAVIEGGGTGASKSGKSPAQLKLVQ